MNTKFYELVAQRRKEQHQMYPDDLEMNDVEWLGLTIKLLGQIAMPTCDRDPDEFLDDTLVELAAHVQGWWESTDKWAEENGPQDDQPVSVGSIPDWQAAAKGDD